MRVIMKISVITPSLNQRQFIEETIESILNQEHKDVELIVVDGVSTDGTVELLQSYGDRFRWISEKDSGQTEAINKGIKMASGDIICYLNSDDYFFPYTLKVVNDYFEAHPEAMWLSGDATIVDENGKEILKYITAYKKFLRFWPNFTTLSIVNFISQPSTFLRREAFEEFGLFKEHLHWDMDYDYWLMLMKKYPLHFLRRSLSAFRLHGDSKSGTAYDKQLDEAYMLVKQYNSNDITRFVHRAHSFLMRAFYQITR